MQRTLHRSFSSEKLQSESANPGVKDPIGILFVVTKAGSDSYKQPLGIAERMKTRELLKWLLLRDAAYRQTDR